MCIRSSSLSVIHLEARARVTRATEWRDGGREERRGPLRKLTARRARVAFNCTAARRDPSDQPIIKNWG